ncbi:unnamed protein product, partial [Ixodes hexagonus]
DPRAFTRGTHGRTPSRCSAEPSQRARDGRTGPAGALIIFRRGAGAAGPFITRGTAPPSRKTRRRGEERAARTKEAFEVLLPAAGQSPARGKSPRRPLARRRPRLFSGARETSLCPAWHRRRNPPSPP